MTIYQDFTLKSDGSTLTADTNFIDAATNTEFEKKTGAVYRKVSTNIFDKADRKIISQTEMDLRYVNAGGDSLLAGALVPSIDATYDLGSGIRRFQDTYSLNFHGTNYNISGNFLPTTNNVSDIGSLTFQFNDIYADQLIGNAASSSTMFSTETDANAAYYLSFGNSSVTGNADMFHDNQIQVNPNSNTITCANFAGNATSSSSVYSTQRDTNGTYYLTFGNSNASSIVNLSHDDQIQVNPSTNTITCTNFAGNASSATNSSFTYVERNDTTNATYYINFSEIGSANRRIRNDGDLRYNPSTNTLTASIFDGVATSSLYADLAEKYVSDAEYPVGTIVEVGGAEEITLFSGGALAGVISSHPGLMLNSKADGQYVALKGKVPAKCEGDISKGQYCIAIPGGKVQGIDKADIHSMIDIVGVALEDSSNGLVMVKV